MRWIPFFAAAVSLLAAAAQEPDSLLVLKGTVSGLSNIDIVEAGAEEGRLWTAFLSFLGSEGLDFREQALSDPLIGHSFSRMVRIHCGPPGEPQLAVFFPVNGAGAAENFLVAARTLLLWKRKPPQVRTEVVLAGAEDPGDPTDNLAMRFFLKELPFPERKALLYVHPAPQAINQLQTIAASVTSPIWMIRSFMKTAAELDFPIEVREIRPSFFRFFLRGQSSPIDAAVLGGLRSLRLIWNPESALLVPALLEGWVAGLTDPLPMDWDRHFVMFGQSPGSLILDQRTYIVFLSLLVVVTITALFFFRNTVRLYAQALRAGFWQIGVYFSLIFLFQYVSTWAVILFRDRLLSRPAAWGQVSVELLLWRISLFFWLYLAFIKYTKRLPLYRWSVFYQAAALALYAVYAFLAFSLNFGFSFYMIWSLVLALAFALVRLRPVKVLLLLFIPVWPLYALILTFLQEGNTELVSNVLFNPIEANLVITLYALPILLLFHAYHFERHQRFDRNEPIQISLLFFFAGAALLVLSFLILSRSLRADYQTRLTELSSFEEGRSELILTGMDPREVEALSQRLAVTPSLTSADRAVFLRGVGPRLTSLRLLSRERFLNRDTYRLSLASAIPAYRHVVRLSTDSPPMVVLDSNFPYVQSDRGRVVEFLIGRNPPRAFEIRFVLQGDRGFTLEVLSNFKPHPEFRDAALEGWDTLLQQSQTLDFR